MVPDGPQIAYHDFSQGPRSSRKAHGVAGIDAEP